MPEAGSGSTLSAEAPGRRGAGTRPRNRPSLTESDSGTELPGICAVMAHLCSQVLQIPKTGLRVRYILGVFWDLLLD